MSVNFTKNKMLSVAQVTISDSGEPPLTYKTQVIITVADDNDNKPVFSQRSYRMQVPESGFHGDNIPVFQVRVTMKLVSATNLLSRSISQFS